MHIVRENHPHPADNGAPQVVAAGFALMVVFMFLLPLARVSFEGAWEPRVLISLLKTDAGFNVFALLLLLAPLAGIAEAMLAPAAWRIASASIALLAAVMVPLALFTLGRETHGIANGMMNVSPGPGSYVLLLGYLTLAIATGTAALRTRRHA